MRSTVRIAATVACAGAAIVVVLLTLATTKSLPTSALIASTEPCERVTGRAAAALSVAAAVVGEVGATPVRLDALRPGFGLTEVGGLVPCSNCTFLVVFDLATGDGERGLGMWGCGV